jgi:hypothetical protein
MLAGLFLLEVYRAATQSLVHDEAFTYQLYLAAPFRAIFTGFDANNHFLATLLMRLSTTLFGFSELAMRLPILLACAWYFLTIFRLALLAFGDGWLLLLAAVLAAANPLMLDLFVAARGYGLALALMMYGIYCIVVFLSRADGRRRGLLVRSAVCLALAVTANLTALFPLVAIAAILAIVLPGRQWGYFLLPCVAIGALFFFVSPIRHAGLGSFYYGVTSLRESVRVLVALSLAHNNGLARWNREVFWKPWWRDFVAIAIGLITIAGVCARKKAAPDDSLQSIA